MKFQPGQSGNPAGRPPGSLNKKTLALQEAFEAKAEEIVDDVVARAKNGQPAAMRLVMERLVPTGRNRRFAIELPAIKTADDAEAAVAVVLAELAAGTLAVHEASSLLLVIDRMLRLVERVLKVRQAEREARELDAHRQAVAAAYAAVASGAVLDPAAPAPAAAPKPAEGSGARLYSPVNQGARGPAEPSAARADGPAPSVSHEAVPKAKAA
jgi:hypothetical protein